MTTRFVFQLSILVAGTALLTGTGCGGSDIAPYDAPSVVSTPSVPIIPATPVVPSTPAAPVRVGDFAFASTVEGGTDRNTTVQNVALAADGTGSTPIVLQSVNGFSAPITFPYTVSITGPTSETIDSSQATVTLSPATLTGLPAGNTTVTLSVRAGATLPPFTRIGVSLYAEGGGLKRYPLVGPYGNEGGNFVFTTPGIGFPSFTLPERLNAVSGSTLTGYGSFQVSGLTGTGTFGVSGLPSGVTATFDTPTITLPTAEEFPRVVITLRSGQSVVSGTYPVRLTLTLNGTTYSSAPANLIIESTASANR